MILKTLVVMLTIITTLSLRATAQPKHNSKIFEDSKMIKQADSLKSLFAKQGFEMIKEATIEMKSQYEMPIILPLREGTWYRVIIIGDITSKLFEVRMYDWNEKGVVYQKQRSKDADGNIINYDYIPQFSEYYMIKPVQINDKKKDVNGHIIMFKKIVQP
jgi:hypothetical protein